MRKHIICSTGISILLLLIFFQACFAAADVVIHTNLGSIEIDLNEEEAPVTTENFLAYVDKGFYSGTVFHRVIADFMIQGGGFSTNMVKKITSDPIINEADNGLTNQRGTIAMARTNRVNSATSQFFINVVDNRFLNHRNSTPSGYGYAVFGEVVAGMDIVDSIAAVPTASKKGMRDVPIKSVVIQSIERI